MLWSIPALSVAAAAPEAAASTCTNCTPTGFGGGNGALSYWSGGNGSTATWTRNGVAVTFTKSSVTGTALANNMTVDTTADGLAGGSGIGDDKNMNGIVLNIQGNATTTPLEVITISFSKQVCNFSMYMRDVSWYSNTAGASDRDAVSWSTTPGKVTSYLGKDKSGVSAPNGAITGNGANGSPTERSTCCGTVPNGNGYYYDLQADWYGAMPTSFTMSYTNGSGNSSAKMYMQIRDLSFCVGA